MVLSASWYVDSISCPLSDTHNASSYATRTSRLLGAQILQRTSTSRVIGRASEPESNKIHAVGCRVPATGQVEDAVDARDGVDDDARVRRVRRVEWYMLRMMQGCKEF